MKVSLKKERHEHDEIAFNWKKNHSITTIWDSTADEFHCSKHILYTVLMWYWAFTVGLKAWAGIVTLLENYNLNYIIITVIYWKSKKSDAASCPNMGSDVLSCVEIGYLSVIKKKKKINITVLICFYYLPFLYSQKFLSQFKVSCCMLLRKP